MDLEKRILIVDDSATMRRIVRLILQSIGFKTIEEAQDGAVALTAVRNKRFDLVLSDCNMPNMNGLELLKLLRTEENTKDLPFIVMTSTEQKETLFEMVKAGASEYIEKPFQAEALKKTLEKFLG